MLFDQFKQVKAFVFVVDGVCTDGGIWIGEQGDRHYRIHSRDYYALCVAAEHGYPIAIVSERRHIGIGRVMGEVGIKDVFLDKGDKGAVLRDWMSGRNLTAEQVLCMGSDTPDLGSMGLAGFGTCPADAIAAVKAVATYISPCNGGAGAVRDVIEKVMKLQGAWV